MVRVIKIEDKNIYMLFADTKSEVAETGAETIGTIGPMGAGSMIYTANADVAILKSDDTWNWIGEE